MAEIDNLLHEDRTVSPVRRLEGARGHRRSGDLRACRGGPGSVLGRIRARARVDPAVGRGRALEIAARGVVRRRKTERQRQLRRSPRAQRPAQSRRDHLGRRARRSPHADLLGSVSSGQRVRQRAEVAGREEGRPRRALPAAHPRARHRHARVRPHRRGPQRRLRRLQRRIAARPHQRCPVRPARDRRRRLSPRPDRAAQADGRRGARPARRRSRTSWWCSGRPARRFRSTSRKAAITGTTA